MTGHVRFTDGRPAPDVTVHVVGAGYEMDGFRGEIATNADGSFDLRVTPNLVYMVIARGEQGAAPPIEGLVVRRDERVEGLEFELGPATRVHGRVTVGADEKSVAGQDMILTQYGRNEHDLEETELPNPGGRRHVVRLSVLHRGVTDEEGLYEFFVGPGKFRLSDAYINGPQLGATMRGTVDFKSQTVDLGGTYVPLYGLNSALGAIPILGKVLVGRKGEGVVGITFAIKGKLDDPNVLVNPMSVMTPGIFRHIFDFTGAVPDSAAAAANPPNYEGVRPYQHR